MIRFGVVLMAISTVLFVLQTPFSFVANNLVYDFIFFIFAILSGVLGVLLLFIGVLRDRIKQKKEEDQDDLSKY
jgi:uncharacterized membrane protein